MPHASTDAAFGAAHHDLVARLADLGLSGHKSHNLARDFLHSLQRDGWHWRPPSTPSPRGTTPGAPPSVEYLAAKEALLVALHAEAEAMAEPTTEGAHL